MADLFENRFKAVTNLSSLFERATLDIGARSSTGDVSPLGNLIKEFEGFANEYFHYVASLSIDGRAYRLNAILNRLQTQWMNISRAAEQRQIQNMDFTSKIAAADGQAKKYFDRFDDTYKPIPTPIVFFDKVFAITRYPFTPYALISMPAQLYDQVGRWQALAHELGHHIYWNSLALETYQDVHEALKAHIASALAKYDSHLMDIWTIWLQESFADICGILMAGVSFAQSAQELALSLLEPSAWTKSEIDTDEHPDPVVRPLIATAVLQWIAESHSQLGADAKQQLLLEVSKLKARWDVVIQKRGTEARVNSIQLSVIKESVPIVVKAILEFDGWVKSKSESKRFGELFKCDAWAANLSKGVEDAINLDPIETLVPSADRNSQAETALPAPNQQDMPRFTALYNHLKSDLLNQHDLTPSEADEKLLDAILELDLGSELPYISGCWKLSTSNYKDGSTPLYYKGPKCS